MEIINELQKHVTLETLYFMFAILVGLDVLTGVIKAWMQGRFRSRTMRNGLFASMGELILLLLAIIIATLIPFAIIIVFSLLIAMGFKELGSISENLTEIGVKLPKWWLKGLQVYTEKLDTLENDNKGVL